jgi:hypothetical protein
MTRASAATDAHAADPPAHAARKFTRILQDYFWHSESPLTILLFLLPMLILYEVGTRYLAYDYVRQVETRVLAFTLVRQFMGLFGATGRYLPVLAVICILLTWHIARRDSWVLKAGTALTMLLESALLALPLLTLSSLLKQYLPLYSSVHGVRGGFILAFGAGIYEELVFRLGAFTLLNILLIDFLKLKKWPAYLLIVVSSAITFSAYHYWSPQSSPFLLSDFLFRTASGVYFGTLFITRGFGVTAGCHVAYDLYYFALRAALNQ